MTPDPIEALFVRHGRFLNYTLLALVVLGVLYVAGRVGASFAGGRVTVIVQQVRGEPTAVDASCQWDEDELVYHCDAKKGGE
ncbi:MAG TPA: hypothetical protein VGG26_09065 [Terracidiphilus sp.]|jgi:hypothetical protein